MAANQAVVNEGFANNAVNIFGEDIFERIGNLGWELDRVGKEDLERNLQISNNLELLAMMSLGYEAARLFKFKDIDEDTMTQEFIEFGVDPDRAKSRTKHLFGSKSQLHPYCYFGPGYFPGMHVVGRVFEKHGKKGTIDLACTDFGPPSLYTLSQEISFT
ncbi:hypothetical protein K8R47_01930 [archaeon]|nr:hypothetical protein [archaeon]